MSWLPSLNRSPVEQPTPQAIRPRRRRAGRRSRPRFGASLERLEGRALMSHVAAINYGSAPNVVENVFAVGSDNNLHVDHFDPTRGWSWVNMGHPAGVPLNLELSAINYSNGGPTYENVFVNANDQTGNLWVDHFDPTSGGWTWVNLGHPGSSFLSGSPAAMNYSLPGVTREYVFVRGSDGNLYADRFDPSSGWSWLNLGHPGGVTIGYSVAPITYGSTPPVANAFVTGSDGNLYADHYNPTSGVWSWVNLGHPSGSSGLIGPAAINYSNGGATYENVFVTGSDSNLYYDHYDPTSGGWTWVNLGDPGANTLNEDAAPINYSNGGATYENVFITSRAGLLFVAHFDPSRGWSWAWQGRPGNVGFDQGLAPINYSNGGATYENVFVIGFDGNLYADHFDPSSGWAWASQGSDHGVYLDPHTLAIVAHPQGSSAPSGSSSATATAQATASPAADATTTSPRALIVPQTGDELSPSRSPAARGLRLGEAGLDRLARDLLG